MTISNSCTHPFTVPYTKLRQCGYCRAILYPFNYSQAEEIQKRFAEEHPSHRDDLDEILDTALLEVVDPIAADGIDSIKDTKSGLEQ
jgi:hypothetical protein